MSTDKHTSNIFHPVWPWVCTVIPVAILVIFSVSAQHLLPGGRGYSSFALAVAWSAHVCWAAVISVRPARPGLLYALFTLFIQAGVGIAFSWQNLPDALTAAVVDEHAPMLLLFFTGPSVIHSFLIMVRVMRFEWKDAWSALSRWKQKATRPFHERWAQRWPLHRTAWSWLEKILLASAYTGSCLLVDYHIVFNTAFGNGVDEWLLGMVFARCLLLWVPMPKGAIGLMLHFLFTLCCSATLLFAVVLAIPDVHHNMSVLLGLGYGHVLIAFPVWLMLEARATMRALAPVQRRMKVELVVATVVRAMAISLLLNSPYRSDLTAPVEKIKILYISPMSSR